MNSETTMRAFAFLLAALLTPAGAQAAEVSVAVAANFTAPMQKIAAAFAQDTGHKAVLSFGSTGRFYAQIRNGAPFQLLLAADDKAPAKLEADGATLPGSRFTYAIGRLVLWSASPDGVDGQGAVLWRGTPTRLAIADPKLAPYGAAAMDVLGRLGVLERWQPRLVQGESIAQTYQFVATGNAPLGFIALSQVQLNGRIEKGSAWVVPARLHAPLRQDAVLLATARGNPAAQALADYLRGEKARAIIRAYGYEL